MKRCLHIVGDWAAFVAALFIFGAMLCLAFVFGGVMREIDRRHKIDRDLLKEA